MRPPSDRLPAGSWLPLRAYLGALLGLFALTALASIPLVRSLEDRAAIHAEAIGETLAANNDD